MKTAIWKKDWFTGLAVILLVLAVHSCSPVINQLERSAYDFGVRGSNRVPADNIAIIAIDDQSIENIGRWPWPRDIHAALIAKLAQAGAKVIAYTPIFSEPQIDPGLDHINALLSFYQKSKLASIQITPPAIAETTSSVTSENASAEITSDTAISEEQENSNELVMNKLDQHSLLLSHIKDDLQRNELTASFNGIRQPLQEIENALYEAQQTLNVDQQLAAITTEAGNVITPTWFLFGQPFGKPNQGLPDFLQKFRLSNIEDRISAQALGQEFLPLETNNAITPIPAIGNAALAVGNINNIPDIDGGTRREPLVVDYFGDKYPSYALLIAAKTLNLDVADITVRLGEGIQLGRLNINTDSQLRMLTFFYGSNIKPPFLIDSFFDVMAGKIPVSKYRGKTVIVGTTASGIGNPQLTPISANLSEAEALAHTVASILNEDFFTIPTWSDIATTVILLAIGLFIMLILPKLGATLGATISFGLLLVLLIGQNVLLTNQAMWVQLMLPISLLIIGYLVLTTKRFLITERGKLHSDLESAESNKMLGLAFQGQGQLDMAFDKFRKCPKNDSIAEVLYNLALDYERKRQFSKSGNIYRYIAEFSPQFRDVKQRMDRSDKMENTIILGGGGPSTATGTLIMESGDVEKPMLGRYEVEKELGKGAMGVVYLGKDPKISRVVAIKTMALSQEFEDDELVEVKERFFREAETAGRLNHPNIVTIYDAGEEHDLAFIAMEFLAGHDLGRYTKPDKLLPLDKVLHIIKKSADALTYAHEQNVVHRDIKPANIMYEPESASVKITDFGIARITDSSKTKTGMVLGTPSYMSPEQLAGKRVDGRSDIFSLGVMLFQMTTGQLPFKADSMASLMYKIANDPHPSVLEVKADLPAALEAIVAKSLEKQVEKRYQIAAEMAADIAKISFPGSEAS